MAREFTAKHIIPIAQKHDQTKEFPDFIVKEALDAGLFPHSIPTEYGGPGYDTVSQSLIVEEWGYGCCAFANILSGNLLSAHLVRMAGNEEQKKHYMGKIVAGGLGGFVLTEPGAGSDAAGLTSTARLDGDEWVLNGSKCFASFCSYADVMVVVASTDPDKGVKGLSAFIVEKHQLTGSNPEHKLGIRCSDSAELSLKNVRIPKENLIGEQGEGFTYCMQTLDVFRTTVGSVSVGCARRALDEAIKYCKEHLDINGKPFASHQTVAFKLADMATQLEAARDLVYDVIRMKDLGVRMSKEASMVKIFACDSAMQICAAAVELMGSLGYSNDSVVEKLMRDIKIYQIFEGSNQIQRIVVSRTLLA
jgi:alkylation response protein AidB-like acyl-CoA dehydrogenase